MNELVQFRQSFEFWDEEGIVEENSYEWCAFDSVGARDLSSDVGSQNSTKSRVKLIKSYLTNRSLINLDHLLLFYF